VPGGINIQLHVQSGASKTELAGRYGDALKIRVASPPVEGKANREVIRYLAQILEVPRGSVALVRGAAGRRKTVAVQGVAADRAERMLGLKNPPD